MLNMQYNQLFFKFNACDHYDAPFTEFVLFSMFDLRRSSMHQSPQFFDFQLYNFFLSKTASQSPLNDSIIKN